MVRGHDHCRDERRKNRPAPSSTGMDLDYGLVLFILKGRLFLSIHSFWSLLCPVECIHLAIQICLVSEYKYPSMMLIFRLIHPRVIQLIYSSIQFITQKPIYLLTNQSINQTQGKQSCPSIQATTSVATQ